MKLTYTVTVEQAVRSAKELMTRSPKWRIIRWSLPVVAVGLASGYSLLEPVHATINDQSSWAFSLVLTMIIQIPIVAIMIYALLFLLVCLLPINVMSKGLHKLPSECWGERTLTISESDVTLQNNLGTRSLKKSIIDDIVETKSAYHLLWGKTCLFCIPKTACTLDELKRALET